MGSELLAALQCPDPGWASWALGERAPRTHCYPARGSMLWGAGFPNVSGLGLQCSDETHMTSLGGSRRPGLAASA